MVKMENILYKELKKLVKEERKEPKMIYLDETGKIKEEPLSNQDSTGAYIKKRKSELKVIYESIFN